jgi:3-oxoacyl-[acyl-carrier protein] reductase
MEFGLKDRVAIVTGASMGLGRAVARELARERASVVIAARNESRLRATADTIRRETGCPVHAVAADMTQPDDIERLVNETLDRFGRIDVAVANAGGPPSTRFETTSPEEVERAVQLNLMSTVRLAHCVAPHMKARQWGRFIAIASMSVKQPIEGLILSNTARAGVVGFVKTMATEMAPHGILCNVVAPGFIRTGRVEDLAAERADAEGREAADVMAEIAGGIPLGRMGEPQELAALVAFLASERASYLTGATIQVDGGYVRGLL